MHHPGPPRFTTVNSSVELAPRNPDPDASERFHWSVRDAPAESDVALGDDPVEHLIPDVPGTYVLSLDAPDGAHDLTVRAYPNVRRPARFTADAGALPPHEDVFVSAPFNDHLLGRDRPRYEDDTFVFETELEPGTHSAMFVPDGDYRQCVRETIEVDGPERPRVELDATVTDGRVVFEATPMPGPETDETGADLDVEFFVDDRDELSQALQVDGRTASCSRSAIEESVRVHAVAVGARHSIADAVSVSESGTVTALNEPPDWTRDATMYEIFTRSFTGQANPGFRELERRVPYLEWLGVDTLWMTPILHSYSPQRDDDGYELGGPHGYHTLDYFRTAPDLGTREEFESFVETCHDHDIRVVFDLVVNHTSRHHPYFQLAQAGLEDYEDYYVWEDDGQPQTYFSWWSIPNLDYDSLAVREHVLSVVDEWGGLVDGFRCDVAWGVPHGFWQEVRDSVKATDSEFFMLDETIPRHPLAGELAFDAHYDTTLYGRLREIGSGEAPARDLLDAVRAEQREGFPPRSVHLRYVENHDEDRYLEECGRPALKAAAAATLTLPGMAMLYYGQETGMTHFRKPMEWGGDDELTRFHRRLVRTRNDEVALRRGEMQAVEFDTESERAVAFARTHGEQRVVVCLHFGEGTATVTVGERLGETDVVTGDCLECRQEDGTTAVAVDSVVVLEA